jgi:hypothetical protein
MKDLNLHKLNTIATGIISAIVLPIIVYFIMYYSKLQDVRFTILSNNLVIGNIIPVLLSHCVLPNLIVFFIFNGLNWTQAMKGLLGTTVALTVLIFAIKLLFSII